MTFITQEIPTPPPYIILHTFPCARLNLSDRSNQYAEFSGTDRAAEYAESKSLPLRLCPQCNSPQVAAAFSQEHDVQPDADWPECLVTCEDWTVPEVAIHSNKCAKYLGRATNIRVRSFATLAEAQSYANTTLIKVRQCQCLAPAARRLEAAQRLKQAQQHARAKQQEAERIKREAELMTAQAEHIDGLMDHAQRLAATLGQQLPCLEAAQHDVTRAVGQLQRMGKDLQSAGFVGDLEAFSIRLSQCEDGIARVGPALRSLSAMLTGIATSISDAAALVGNADALTGGII